jgi:membrane-associated protein
MFSIESIVASFGLLGLTAVIFAETGLFIGFFLPGDSLLFTAGILASQGYFNIALVCLAMFVAAVTGNCVGYLFGKHVGRRLFHKKDSLLFHRDHLDKAHTFYEKYGGKTIILARFIPIIRTFAPIVAGIADLSFVTFLFYSTVGGLIWAVGLPLAGFFLGRAIPDIDHYLLPIILLIVIISLAPALYEMVHTKEKRANLQKMILGLLKKRG